MSGTQPILAVAMSLLGESGKGAAKDLLETTLRDFIDGKVSLAKARSVFASHAGNEKPVLRLHQIMSVDECPLPATGDLFFASGSDLRSLNPRKKARPWTEQEDTRLLAGIFRFGLDSWKAVAEFVGSGRSQAQCSQRWNRGLDPRLSRVQWSTEEDEKLIELVRQYGTHSWTKVACTLGHRSDAQCRYRYFQICEDGDEREQPRVPQAMSVPMTQFQVQVRPPPLLMGARSMKFTKPMLPSIRDLMKDEEFERRAGIKV